MEGFWLEQGWYRIARGGWELTSGRWKEGGAETREAAVRYLLEEVLCKDPRDATGPDFRAHRLAGLLSHFYQGSAWRAVSEAFPELDIEPWEMATTPHRLFHDAGHRIAAVRWLVDETGKDPRDLVVEDFLSNRLAVLIGGSYGGSPFKAVQEAFPELDIEPWELATTPHRFFEKRENRVAAVRWLVDETGKDPRDLRREDFDSGRLAGLITHHYRGGVYSAVKEAFPELGVEPWEMKIAPVGWNVPKGNRIAAVRWLVDKVGKDPRGLNYHDFFSNHLGGLLTQRYDSSPFSAVQEAFPELDIKAWEMLKTPSKFFDRKSNRVAAVCWLVEKTGKDPREHGLRDFTSNGLAGLITHRYGSSPFAAMTEAFPRLHLKAWEMKITPLGFFDTKKNRVAAVRWLVERTGKDPRELELRDYTSNGLSRFIKHRYGNSCRGRYKMPPAGRQKCPRRDGAQDAGLIGTG